MKKYEFFSSEIDQALEDMESNDDRENAWAFLAPTTEQHHADDTEEGVQLEDNLMTGYDPEENETTDENLGSNISQYEKTNELLPTQDYYGLVQSLNCLQTSIHQF